MRRALVAVAALSALVACSSSLQKTGVIPPLGTPPPTTVAAPTPSIAPPTTAPAPTTAAATTSAPIATTSAPTAVATGPVTAADDPLAIAAIQAYVAGYNKSFQTGNPKYMQDAVDPLCPCRNDGLSLLRYVREHSETTTFSEMLMGLSVTARAHNAERIQGRVHADAFTFFGKGGKVDRREPGDSGAIDITVTRNTAGRWLVTDVAVGAA